MPITSSPPTIHITASLHQQIVAHAEQCYPYEACGLFMGIVNSLYDITLTDYVESINRAENPAIAFVIDPLTHITLQKAARLKGEQVLGVFHSHPEGEATLSETDKKNAIYSKFLWMIASVHHKKVGAIHGFVAMPEGDGFIPVMLNIILDQAEAVRPLSKQGSIETNNNR